MSRLVKQVCFSYGESPRTPPLEGTSDNRWNISVERPWGILSLFTTCLPLWVKSYHQSCCHVSPIQKLRACILRRQCSPARKNRTRKKKSMVEDAWKIPEKNKKIEHSEQLKSTESLKWERPKNKPEKRTKYIKTALQIAKNGTSKDRKAKEQARAEKANQWLDPSSLNCSEDNPSRKELGGR